MDIEQATLDELILGFAQEGIFLGTTEDKVFLTTRYEFALSIDEAAHIIARLAENFSKSQNYGILRSRVQMGQRKWYLDFGYKTMPGQRDSPLNYFATAYFLEKKSEDRNAVLVVDYLRMPENETAILNLMRVVYSAHQKIKTPSET